jgi:hypothetical protein
MDITEFRKIPAEERLEKASERALNHINRPLPIKNRQRVHAKEWTMEAAHAVFELHPELREEGSLLRYFVAREGRKQGIFGAALTEFVESQFQAGTWWRYVPEEVLKQSHSGS